LDTEVHDALQELLERGGVIGGSSAGATILGSYLARGDTSSNAIMMGDHKEGFGFISNIAIDQHLLRRNRQIDSGGPFYFLEPGDRYDFTERQAYRPGRSLEPLERIVESGN
jgi:hypothetical protein